MPAYVLGALSAEERLDYESVLRMPEHASVMRGEFDACQLTVNALAAAQPAEPPADLFSHIVERIGLLGSGSTSAKNPSGPASQPDGDAPMIDRREGAERRVGAASVGSTSDSTAENRRKHLRREDDRRLAEAASAEDQGPVKSLPMSEHEQRPMSDLVQEPVQESLQESEATVLQTVVQDEVVVETSGVNARRFTPTGRTTRLPTQSMIPAVEVRSSALLGVGWWIAGVLFLGLAAVGYYAAQLKRERDLFDTRNRETRALLSRSDARLAERERLMATLLGGRASVLLVNLRGPAQDGPDAQLFWNVREGRAILNAFGLSRLGADRRYQLWMVRDGVTTPLVEVEPNDAGAVLVPRIDMPSSPTGVTRIFLTNEARTDSTGVPTTPHVLDGSIPIQWQQ